MSNVTELHSPTDHRALVIGEVRAEMGRKRMNASAIARRTGRPQQYWSRRLTGLTAFDIDDLAVLSAVLQVPMSAFIPSYVPGEDVVKSRTSDYKSVISEAVIIDARHRFITDASAAGDAA